MHRNIRQRFQFVAEVLCEIFNEYQFEMSFSINYVDFKHNPVWYFIWSQNWVLFLWFEESWFIISGVLFFSSYAAQCFSDNSIVTNYSFLHTWRRNLCSRGSYPLCQYFECKQIQVAWGHCLRQLVSFFLVAKVFQEIEYGD